MNSFQPDDASVRLFEDEERYQLEPEDGALAATLPSGNRRAEVEREGYRSHQLEFEVEGGETRTVEVVLEPAVGTVLFEVEPSTAEVELVSAEEESEAQSLPRAAGTGSSRSAATSPESTPPATTGRTRPSRYARASRQRLR
jgi:hypothetical protein